jgi:hypothetical protein
MNDKKPKTIRTQAGLVGAIHDMREATVALKQLSDLEDLVDVPPERGGMYFSDWEREFVKSACAQLDSFPEFTPAQRDKIAEVWHAVDLRKRAVPEEQAQNLFSKLSPERQAEQRARAAKVKLPWEK